MNDKQQLAAMGEHLAEQGHSVLNPATLPDGRVIDLLRTSVDHFSANELADLHQLCDAELTKRDAAVCGGQKYIDAHWFERGELPPVGIVCQAKLWDRDWATMTIKGYHENTVWAGTSLCSLDKAKFRPIPSERDVLLSVIVEEMNHYDTDGKLADAILAAGFSLRDK